MFDTPHQRQKDIAIDELHALIANCNRLMGVLQASVTLLQNDLHSIQQCHDVVDKALNEFNNVINGIGQQSMEY